MSSKLRTLVASIVIAVAAMSGALFLAHERSERSLPQPSAIERSGSVATLDVRALLQNPRSLDQTMVERSFRQAEDVFYKPVNPQTLLSGEHRALITYLQKHNIKNPQLTPLFATGNQSDDARALKRELREAQSQYGARVGYTELTQAAIAGVMNSLNDPYTTYLSPKEIQRLQEQLSGGDFGGIGVYIVQDQKGEVLLDPIEDTPAARAGVKPGDQVIAVDGHPVKGIKLDVVERMIRGRAGSTVVLRLATRAKKIEKNVSVQRETIHVPSVHARFEDGVEYVRLSDFGDTSYDEVRKAMLDGKTKHATGYILDLRNNGGGLLEAAVEISSLFIKDGAIVSTIDRSGSRDTKSATHQTVGAAPLVLLVNKYTASASEITAGAIQDYKVGTLVGTKTFGKGVVQSIYHLADNSALKITTAKYVTPLGRDIQHKGITPDVTVEGDPSVIDTPKDKQLAAAKQILHRMAQTGN